MNLKEIAVCLENAKKMPTEVGMCKVIEFNK